MYVLCYIYVPYNTKNTVIKRCNNDHIINLKQKIEEKKIMYCIVSLVEARVSKMFTKKKLDLDKTLLNVNFILIFSILLIFD